MPRRALGQLTSLSILVVLVTACAVPTSVRVASIAVDVFSYATTQKSVTDHGLSLISGQDCAMLRLVSEGSACRPKASSTIDFNGNLTPSQKPAYWSASAKCDPATLAADLPNTTALNACAGHLIETYGTFDALDYADKRIEYLVNTNQTDQAALWTAIHLTLRQQIDASYGRVAEY